MGFRNESKPEGDVYIPTLDNIKQMTFDSLISIIGIDKRVKCI